MARGRQGGGVDVTAMEMTKWFDTNYHYIVPELERGMSFRLSSRKPFDEYQEAKELGIETKPVLIGPLTLLLQGKCAGEEFDRLELLDSLVEVYAEVLRELGGSAPSGCRSTSRCWSRTAPPRSWRRSSAPTGGSGRSRAPKIVVNTYFDHVGEAFPVLARLPVAGIGLDFVRGEHKPRTRSPARVARRQDDLRRCRLRSQRLDQRPVAQPRAPA